MWRVFLDGVQQSDCVRGHTDEGWIDVYVRDERGAFVIDGQGRDAELRVARVHGDVELRPPPEAS